MSIKEEKKKIIKEEVHVSNESLQIYEIYIKKFVSFS